MSLTKLYQRHPTLRIKSVCEVTERPHKIKWEEGTKHYKYVIALRLDNKSRQATFYVSVAKNCSHELTLDSVLIALRMSALHADATYSLIRSMGAESDQEAIQILKGCKEVKQSLIRLLGDEGYKDLVEVEK